MPFEEGELEVNNQRTYVAAPDTHLARNWRPPGGYWGLKCTTSYAADSTYL